jgi:phenylacetate-CoA oxygenase PaaI subunit
MSATTSKTTETSRESMISLVGSLADNKAALGRRYSEWAVSAPTLESAVAAAAMAQDELGHARSTYPVLKALGAEVDEDSFGGDRRLALLDADLPTWAAFIAANLLVDGMLVTFVAACQDSSVSVMAQRVKKILQEEGSHRAHAEAWARRLAHGGDKERQLLIEAIGRTWEEAARWVGPNDDEGYRAAMAEGMVTATPDEIRDTVRNWLVDLLASEGVQLELPEPADWSRWDPSRRRLVL